jgi:hypothetical protein
LLHARATIFKELYDPAVCGKPTPMPPKGKQERTGKVYIIFFLFGATTLEKGSSFIGFSFVLFVGDVRQSIKRRLAMGGKAMQAEHKANRKARGENASLGARLKRDPVSLKNKQWGLSPFHSSISLFHQSTHFWFIWWLYRVYLI